MLPASRLRAPTYPFKRNTLSPLSRGLALWYPNHGSHSGRIRDFSGNGLHASTSGFEAANFVHDRRGYPALNINATGAADADFATLASDPRITINSRPFTLIARASIRSLGLGSFVNFGRIFDKGGIVTFRFDAGSGSFGAGAGVRILLDRTTSGTSQRKAGGTTSEIPLNTDLDIVLTHNGGLAHSGVHIYTNGNEITYTAASQDGTGSFTDDSSTAVTMYERAGSGDRLYDGLARGMVLIMDRALSPGEVRNLDYDSLFDDFDIERFIISSGLSAALGLITETDTVLSLSAAKSKALGLITETDSVLAIPIGQTAELGLVAETDSVLAIATNAKTKAIGLISETDEVLGIAAAKTGALGLITETNAVLALGASKTRALSIIAETDAVLPLISGLVAELGLITETEQVLSLSAAKAKALGIITETDVVLGISLLPVDAVTGTRPSNARVGYRGVIRVRHLSSQPELHFGGGLVIEVQGAPGPDNRGDGLLLIDPDDFLLVN